MSIKPETSALKLFKRLYFYKLWIKIETSNLWILCQIRYSFEDDANKLTNCFSLSHHHSTTPRAFNAASKRHFQMSILLIGMQLHSFYCLDSYEYWGTCPYKWQLTAQYMRFVLKLKKRNYLTTCEFSVYICKILFTCTRFIKLDCMSNK